MGYTEILEHIDRISDAKIELKKSIKNKGVIVPDSTKLDGYASLINSIQSIRTMMPVEEKDVNFYDYDGTVLHSYTASEFLSLTEMPITASHYGLISQGWNWTLEDAKAQVTATGACDIGQLYITNDGSTRIHCTFNNNNKTFYFNLGVKGTVYVDWGDGTGGAELTGTSQTVTQSAQHTYASAGNYIISIYVNSGYFSFLYGRKSDTDGNESRLFTTVPGVEGAQTNVNDAKYRSVVHEINFGTGACCNSSSYIFINFYSLEYVSLPKSFSNYAIGSHLFFYCYSLKHLTLPPGLTSLPSNFMAYAYCVKTVSIPKSITTFAASCFSYMYSLHRIVFPYSATSFSSNTLYNDYGLKYVSLSTTAGSVSSSMMYNCYGLSKIIVPASVTTINATAFYNCYGVQEYHFKRTTPPTLSNVNAFNNIQSDCKIYVPTASVDTYKTAQNWSNYASYIYGE